MVNYATTENLDNLADNLENGLLFKIAADLKSKHGESRNLRLRDGVESDSYYGNDWPIKTLEVQTGERFSLLRLKRRLIFEPIVVLEYAGSGHNKWVKVHSYDSKIERYRKSFQEVAEKVGRSSFYWATSGYEENSGQNQDDPIESN